MSPLPLALWLPPAARATGFPEASPLNAFFEWNRARRTRDRRYVIACDILSLLARFGGDDGREVCVAHLTGTPVILWRFGARLFLSASGLRRARAQLHAAPNPAAATARRLVEDLVAAAGSADVALHAAVFAGFEALAASIDLSSLARRRPRARPAPRPPARRILVIKLGALGDLVQALGTVPAIRRHHGGAHITLLTSARYVEFAERTGLFDAVLVDRRPKRFDLQGWLALGRRLRALRFDRVYDLQTSDRSSAYAWLLRPGLPEWSGIGWHCSHPHANRNRDRQHTLDRQAEQLLMAGVHPVPLANWLPPLAAAPFPGVSPPFALLIPGSSPFRADKRWPAERFGELAARLRGCGYQPVIVGVTGEEETAQTMRDFCPAALDLVGRTDVAGLAALARQAAVTIGNDTGATHVAAAGGNPVLVLFSQASAPELCAPRGARVRVLPAADLADLSVDSVFAAANALAISPASA